MGEFANSEGLVKKEGQREVNKGKVGSARKSVDFSLQRRASGLLSSQQVESLGELYKARHGCEARPEETK